MIPALRRVGVAITSAALAATVALVVPASAQPPTPQVTSRGVAGTVAVIGDSTIWRAGAATAASLEAVGFKPGSIFVGACGGRKLTGPDACGGSSYRDFDSATSRLGHVDTWVISLGINSRKLTDDAFRSQVRHIVEHLSPSRILWMDAGMWSAANTSSLHATKLLHQVVDPYPNARVLRWGPFVHSAAIADPSLWAYPEDATHNSGMPGNPGAGYGLRSMYIAAQVAAVS